MAFSVSLPYLQLHIPMCQMLDESGQVEPYIYETSRLADVEQGHGSSVTWKSCFVAVYYKHVSYKHVSYKHAIAIDVSPVRRVPVKHL